MGETVQTIQVSARARLIAAAIGAAGAGLFAVIAWGGVTGITGLHTELKWVPMVGIGFLVGTMTRKLGGGTGWRFRMIGAVVALLATAATQIAAVSIAVAWQAGLGNFFLLNPSNAPSLARLLRASLGWPDLLCYAFGIWEAWRLSATKPNQPKSTPGRGRVILMWAVILLSFPALVGLTYLSVSRWAITRLLAAADGQTLAIGYHTIDGSGKLEVRRTGSDQPGVVLGGRGGRGDAVGDPAFVGGGASMLLVRSKQEQRANQPGLHSYSELASWDPFSGENPVALGRFADVVPWILADASGQRLVTAERDGKLIVWSVPGSRPLQTLPRPAQLTALALSASGDLLAGGTPTGELWLWDLRTSAHWTLKAHNSVIKAIAFHSDGRTLATAGGLDRTVAVWDVGSPTPKARYAVGMDWLTCLAISPDGQSLAVGGGSFHRRGEVELRDMATGRMLRVFKANTNTVRALVFARGGRTLVAGNAQALSISSFKSAESLLQWDLDPAAPAGRP